LKYKIVLLKIDARLNELYNVAMGLQQKPIGWVLDPGMATLVLIHSMIGIKWGKFLALAHSKTKKRVLK
jgi:hypothetical protein